MTATVSDVIRAMEALAPPRLAEDWDNSGLQLGAKDWPAQKVLIALDPLPSVIQAACQNQVNLLVTHHPLIFKPLKSINCATPLGKMIQTAIAGQLAVYAAHTNLDSADGGLNDILADRMGLVDRGPLVPASARPRYKLVIYGPQSHEKALIQSLEQSTAGRIGDYSHCAFRHTGTGRFRPGPQARPFSGVAGEPSEQAEIRVETTVSEAEIPAVLACIRQSHPYETPVYDLYPLKPEPATQGMGRQGRLPSPLSLADFAAGLKSELGLSDIRMAGRPDLQVEQVALCTGSGASLFGRFLSSPAQVFVSGDLGYHPAQEAVMRDRGLIDIGHFGSEHLMVEALRESLDQALKKQGLTVAVNAYQLETNPFIMV